MFESKPSGGRNFGNGPTSNGVGAKRGGWRNAPPQVTQFRRDLISADNLHFSCFLLSANPVFIPSQNKEISVQLYISTIYKYGFV